MKYKRKGPESHVQKHTYRITQYNMCPEKPATKIVKNLPS